MARRLLVAATALAALAVVVLPAAKAADSADVYSWLSATWGVENFSSAKLGGAMTFNAGATNSGPNAAANVTLTVTLPSGTGFLLVTVSDYRGTTCDVQPDLDTANSDLVCTAPSVPSRGYMEVEVTVSVPSSGGPLRTDATVTSDTADPNAGNNASYATTSLYGSPSPQADLSAGGGTSVPAVIPGHDFSASVSLGNGTSPIDPAVHPRLTVSLPAGVTLVSGPPPDPAFPHDGCGWVETALVCHTPVLLDGTGRSFPLTLHLASSAVLGSTLHVGVSGASDTTDPNPDNDSSTFDVYVGGADITMDVAGPPTAPAGDDASYTLTVSNDGPEAATSPGFSFWAPWGTSFVSLQQTSGPTFDCETTNVEGGYQTQCAAAALAVGASSQFTAVVNLDPDLEIGDSISMGPHAWSETPDPDGDNNADDVSTVVSGLAVPTIDDFTPHYAAVGTVVTITGAALSGTTDVVFGTTHATTYTVDSDTQLHATVPKGTTTGAVTVTTAAGSATSADPLTILTARPVLTSFTPNHGVVGDTVTITGSKLTGATAVLFAGTPAAVTPVDDRHVVAHVPPGAAMGRIGVTNAVGTTTSGAVFTPVHPPSIDSFTPAGGRRGSVVTLSGSGFLAMNDATLGGVDATFRVVSDTVMTVTVPTTASTGTITVVNDADAATSGGPFTVILPPKVTSFTPPHGPANTTYSTDVTIDGSGFIGTDSVKIGSRPAVIVSLTDTRIVATTAVGTASGRVTVHNVAGTSVSKTTFLVDQPPVVTSFTPALGRRTATRVTITGRNFTPGAIVDFNGTTALDTIVVSKTRITATVPPGSTTGKVTVTNGYGAGGSAKDFGVILAPAIDHFTPELGARIGASVSVVGSGFLGTSSVTFAGVAATFTVKSDTLIVVRVPSRATTGKIRVTNPEGFAETAGDFAVQR